MLMQANASGAAAAHVVVLGNEKGGTGKSTIAMHLAIALINLGQRVATIDLDVRQKTLTHYIENRRQWARQCPCRLAAPTHFCVARGVTQNQESNESFEFTGFVDALTAAEQEHDFIVVDTAGSDHHLTRLAHSMANILVTPLNDSFVDFDVLGTIDPLTYAVTGESHYAGLVRESRQQRRLVDGVRMDWVVVRNRLTVADTRNKARIVNGLSELATRLGFRTGDALAERVVYRELFPRGLTALDDLDEKTLGTRPNMSHLAARRELVILLDTLKLPLDERARAHAAAQAEWIAVRDTPLELHDVLA
jgi:chromosome partitioning protein